MDRVHVDQQTPVKRITLRSGPVSCPGNGAETVLKESDPVPNGLYGYLVARAYYVGAAPTDVKFRSYRGGVPLGDDPEFERNTTLGAIGDPAKEAVYIPIMGGKTFKITFINNDAVTYDDVEVDGYIECYREPLR